MIFRRLDERSLVSGQIRPEDLPEAAAAGVTMVVNNRPDGEEPGQPPSAEIEAAAQAAGLAYRYIPVAGGLTPAQVEAMAEALQGGTILAFCRSGTRSTWLWALARARLGDDADSLIEKATAAGYDISPILRYLPPR
ncbi:MAG: family phosphatase [Alphaproteobacteria bacterium]|nr:family phosphatase [Alphaproteobacteria bacterium]